MSAFILRWSDVLDVVILLLATISICVALKLAPLMTGTYISLLEWIRRSHKYSSQAEAAISAPPCATQQPEPQEPQVPAAVNADALLRDALAEVVGEEKILDAALEGIMLQQQSKPNGEKQPLLLHEERKEHADRQTSSTQLNGTAEGAAPPRSSQRFSSKQTAHSEGKEIENDEAALLAEMLKQFREEENMFDDAFQQVNKPGQRK